MFVAEEIDIKSTLKEIFGYDSFRGAQEEIINSILSGKNTFVIMPTGAGKSLCYQLPAIVQEGTAIVISPLIALMKNQVDQLVALGINAQFLNSTLNKTEMNRVKKEVLSGEVKLLYVAPESLTKEENIEFLRKANISFVAIDEAHCISEWGHDFRPEYRRIKAIIHEVGNLPIIALTATATPKVQVDIQKNLDMEEAALFKTSFNRKNLFYQIVPKNDPNKQVIRFVKSQKGKAGIVYCLSRKKVEEIADLLVVNGVKALPYHAGLDAPIRVANQDAFLKEDCEVIVATIAFGMGIDKPDVRFVVHYDTPKSLEGYYQETGRGGRDGIDGQCLMLYSMDDIIKLEKFNKDKTVNERDNAKHLLYEMASYAESNICRRKLLLHYFGEYLEKDCGFCDNCKKPKVNFEGMEDVLLILKAVVKTEQRFATDHIINVIRGKETEYITSYNHDELEEFGEGDDQEEEYWESAIKQITIQEFLTKDIDNGGALKITKKGQDFIKKPYSITLSKVVTPDANEEIVDAGANVSAYDEVLFSLLKNLRKKVAKEKNLPPYVIFQDPSLEEMSTSYPTSAEELANIQGVGMGKVQKFGKQFLEVITKYVTENDIITAKDVVVKQAANKSKIKIFIIQQIDRKVELEEICETKDITPDNLLTEIEHICFSGTKLNLDYYIDKNIDYDKQDTILEFFMTAESDDIATAMKVLGPDYSEEECRIMRIKFMSDVAN
jgi:ATP-dependent DNA helicase RecQ